MTLKTRKSTFNDDCVIQPKGEVICVNLSLASYNILLTISIHGTELLDIFPKTAVIFLWHRNEINIKRSDSMAKEDKATTINKRGRKPYCDGIRKRVTFFMDKTALNCLDQLCPDIVRSEFVSYCIKKEILGEDYEQ